MGGEDHKVGEDADTEGHFQRLRTYLAARYGALEVTHAWSGQIIESMDGLPYVGRNSMDKRVFIATTLSGNGMTLGTLAGTMLADVVLGRDNRWAQLYQATRLPPAIEAGRYLKDNLATARHLVADRFRSDSVGLADLEPGQGAVVAGRQGGRAGGWRSSGTTPGV